MGGRRGGRGRAAPLSWSSALWYAHGLFRDYNLPAAARTEPCAYEIAHAVRGRLRVRYPPPWLSARRDVVESGLRAVPGVRTVSGSPLTGSVRIEYDPFPLAEHGIVQALEQIHARLGVPAPRRRRPAPSSRAYGPPHAAARLSWARAPCWRRRSCRRPALVAGLVVASDVPALLRAVAALGRRRLNGDVLEASTLLLLMARRH